MHHPPARQSHRDAQKETHKAHLEEVLPKSRGVGQRRSARAVNRKDAILGPGACPAGGAPPDWFTPHRRARSDTPYLIRLVRHLGNRSLIRATALTQPTV